jgi:DNA polymerase III, epsilon subunit and related 3''-5'' exonucleases
MSEQESLPINRSLELCRRVVTTESFIAEAKEIYGDRYDYNKVDYKNRDNRVTVVCPIHGDFQVYAREHLDGKGCPKCEKGEKFIAKLKEKFGDKFGLEEFVYDSSTSPVTLICPVHGTFSRLPHQILNAPLGCPECGNDLLNQRREQAHQDAIEHKEERDQARKERYRARKEAERIREEEKKRAEEALAKEKWKDKIQDILDYRNRRIADSEIDLFAESPDERWFEDFFGLNLNALCNEDGTPLDGKQYVFLRPKHWPLTQMKVETNQGELVKATFYVCDLEREQLYELLLILENIFSGGYLGSIEDIKEKFNPYIDQVFSFDGIKDGYKIVFNQWTLLDVTIKIRKIGTKVQRPRNYPRIVAKTLPKSFVGIDFETLYPQRVSACSVGMVKYIDGEIVDRFYSLIRPPLDYPGKCGSVLTWIHGLTEEMVKDARTFKEILPQMESFVNGLPLVAHNACVERACIRDASAFYGVETKLDFENIYDTLPLSRQAEAKLGISEEGPGTHQLDTVCKRFGIAGNNHHNALADAEMSGNLMVLFQKILSEGETVEVSETPTTPKQKYNPEDKVQRTDLESVVENPFKNQVVVLTGFAKSDSQEYAHKLNKLGAIIKDGVNKKTNILITGYNAGPSKMQKAQEVGARIISEEEFKEIIKQIKEQFYE